MELMNIFPVVAIMGPRQCGKTFIANQIKHDHYFDLEDPDDFDRFSDASLLLKPLKGIIIIDEIQRKPELFPLLRHLADFQPEQKYIVLGSASFDLVKSTESLAGRVGYIYLDGLSLKDIGKEHWRKLWLAGGLPRSYLAPAIKASNQWRKNYIRTFLEKDIPRLGINIPSETLRKFWMMLCHYHGQIINYSEIGGAFGISDVTVRKYIDILSKTYMVRILPPWYVNIGKRLVKHPKVYIRDSGVLHYLLSIKDEEFLQVHPKIGASWEGFALEQTAKVIEKEPEELFFWSTHKGAEIDLFWMENGKHWGVEFKYGSSPKLTPSMRTAMEDLKLEKIWVIYPGKDRYKIHEKIEVLPVTDIERIKRYD